jgi:hypothetical protein
MADEADDANERAELYRSSSISRVKEQAAAIPTGVAGHCSECGEFFTRLVAGRCGFCRDGR